MQSCTFQRIVIFSSINEDLTLRLPHFPAPGETTLSTNSTRALGGKGANTAVAAAKASAGSIPVSLVGAIGDDPTGASLLDQLSGKHGVDVSHVARIPNSETGRAVILVDEGGENCIVVNAGANSLVKMSDHLLYSDLKIVLGMHLEIPIKVVCDAAQFVKQPGRPGFVVLNPSPIPADISALDGIWRFVDLLIINEGEVQALASHPIDPDNIENLSKLRYALPVKCDRTSIIVTLGARGAVLLTEGGETVRVCAVATSNVVDTTGAGDCLTGYVCAGIANGWDIERALRVAVSAASLSVQRHGAADAVPTLDDTLLNGRSH